MNSPRQQKEEITTSTLDGKRALVTGASGHIGGAIATRLATAGAAVMLHGHQSADSLEATKNRIIARGGHASTRLADLSHQQEISGLIEETQKAWAGSIS